MWANLCRYDETFEDDISHVISFIPHEQCIKRLSYFLQTNALGTEPLCHAQVTNSIISY